MISCSALHAGAASLFTVAGGGTDDGQIATLAQLGSPKDAIFDAAGNLYIADAALGRVRKVDAATKIITTFVELEGAEALAFDAQGNLYVSQGTSIVRVDAATRVVTLFAGDGRGFPLGDGGPAISAGISSAEGMAFDNAGNLYIADYTNYRIRKVTAATGIITTVAGNGTFGFSGDGGPATAAALRVPSDVVIDPAGNLYIADSFNHRIRKVDAATQIITTIAGGAQGFGGDGGPATAAQLSQPNGLFRDSAGNLYVADTNNQRIRRIDAATQTITTVAGMGSFGFSGDGGPALQAGMLRPENIALDTSANLYITDTGGRIRRVDAASNIIETFAGGGSPAEGVHARSTVLLYPQAAIFDSGGAMYVSASQRIYKIDPITRVITLFAGNGTTPTSGDGGPAVAAGFAYTGDLALDPAGNLYVADLARVRKITAGTNIITTVAGTGTSGFSGDGGPATAATLGLFVKVALDVAGNLYIADTFNHRIRMVNESTQQIVTIAGTGVEGYSGNGGLATAAMLSSPADLAFDRTGSLIIADEDNHVVRMVQAGSGIITAIAGIGEPGQSGDGGPANLARLTSPNAIAHAPDGTIYIGDHGSAFVRAIHRPTGVITTVAGSGASGFGGDAARSNTSINGVADLAVDARGTLYLVESANHRVRMLGSTDRRRSARR